MTFYEWWQRAGAGHVYNVEDARTGWEACLQYADKEVPTESETTLYTLDEARVVLAQETVNDDRDAGTGVVETVKRAFSRSRRGRPPTRKTAKTA